MTLESRGNCNSFIAGGRFKWDKEKELWNRTCILFNTSHLCDLNKLWVSLSRFSHLYSGSNSHLSEFMRLAEIICLTHSRYSTNVVIIFAELWNFKVTSDPSLSLTPTSDPSTNSVYSPWRYISRIQPHLTTFLITSLDYATILSAMGSSSSVLTASILVPLITLKTTARVTLLKSSEILLLLPQTLPATFHLTQNEILSPTTANKALHDLALSPTSVTLSPPVTSLQPHCPFKRHPKVTQTCCFSRKLKNRVGPLTPSISVYMSLYQRSFYERAAPHHSLPSTFLYLSPN